MRTTVQEMEYPAIVGPCDAETPGRNRQLTKENVELEAKVKELELDLRKQLLDQMT